LLVTLLIIPFAVKLDTLRNRTKSTDIFTGDVTNYLSDNDSVLLVRGTDTANIVRHTHKVAKFQRVENCSITNRASDYHISGVGLSGTRRGAREERFAKPAWQEILAQCRCGKISRKEITYYRSQEVTAAANAGPAHILLTHDWPADPDMDDAGAPRAELLIASAVRPKFHFCGHRHRSAAFAAGGTEVRALNRIGDKAKDSSLSPAPNTAALASA
jgi:hypothetical protein